MSTLCSCEKSFWEREWITSCLYWSDAQNNDQWVGGGSRGTVPCLYESEHLLQTWRGSLVWQTIKCCIVWKNLLQVYHKIQTNISENTSTDLYTQQQNPRTPTDKKTYQEIWTLPSKLLKMTDSIRTILVPF